MAGLQDPNKKKFVPNLNVQRRDKSDAVQVKNEIKKEAGFHQRQPHARGGGAAGNVKAIHRLNFISIKEKILSSTIY